MRHFGRALVYPLQALFGKPLSLQN